MRDDNLIKMSSRTETTATGGTQVQGGIERTPLQTIDFPDGYTFNASIIEVQSGTTADRHTHPGVEIGYILDGEADLFIEREAGVINQDNPDLHLKAGVSYLIPVDAVHYARVRGVKALKVLSIFVFDKTKPVATVEGPAPD